LSGSSKVHVAERKILQVRYLTYGWLFYKVHLFPPEKLQQNGTKIQNFITCKIFLSATCTLDEPDKHFSHKLLLYFAFFVKWVNSLDFSQECQKFVNKLFAFFSKEKAAKKPIVSFDRVYQKTSKALGVSYTSLKP
jgi:hypothetical protein